VPGTVGDVAAGAPDLGEDGPARQPGKQTAGTPAIAHPFDTLYPMDLVGRWWNGQQGPNRRDIWLTSGNARWHVRARHGDRELHRDLDREHQARALVDQLKATAPGAWKDITQLLRRPTTPGR
jgi:hypothetical protein